MQNHQVTDIHGLSKRGTDHDQNHDHFAIASLSKSMRLHQSNLTIDDESRVHGHNQGQLFLVADGISGGPTPARASGTAVDSVVRFFLNEMPWYHFADGNPRDVTVALEDALRNAQDELLRNAAPDNLGLGTTMTLAFVFWPDLYVAHVGDSRCYLSRSGELHRLTTDHTLAELRRSIGGEVTPRSEHVLWNAVGGGEGRIQPEVQHHVLESGDVLALVTDGVTGLRSEAELQKLLDREVSAEQLCKQLIHHSGSDDRTAIVARFFPHEHVEVLANDDQPQSPLSAGRELPLSSGDTPSCETLRRAGMPVSVASDKKEAV